MQERGVLMTYHGSFLCFETASGNLVHRTEQQLCADCQIASASLTIDTSAGRIAPIVQLHPSHGASAVFPKTYIVKLNENSRKISLHYGEFYLAANGDGSVACDRTSAGAWETYIFLTEHEMQQLRQLNSFDWVMQNSGQRFFASEGGWTPNFVFKFGTFSLDLTLGHPILAARTVPSPDGGNVMLSCVLLADGWKILGEVLVVRPMIYFVAFGSEDVFVQLKWSLISLVHFGKYKGSLHVISDKPISYVEQFIPEELRATLTVQFRPANDFFDYCFSRYRIYEWSGAKVYQPLIYVDTDIAFDKPLSEAFYDLVCSDKIDVVAEPFSLRAKDVGAGSALFGLDESDVGLSTGFNAGAFSIPNYVVGIQVAEVVLNVASNYVALHGRKTLKMNDQPFLNYCAFKLSLFETRVLSKYARVGTLDSPTEVQFRKGMIHFWPCRGQRAKREAMQTFVENCITAELVEGQAHVTTL